MNRPMQSQLVQIVANGGGLRIKSGGMTVEQLVQLAAHAKGRASLTIVVDGALLQEQLVQIAANGGGAVVFDFAS